MFRKLASMSVLLSPSSTFTMALLSSTVTFTGNSPVRPLACAVSTVPAVSSAAGSALGRFSQAAFTAATTALLLTVAPATTSMDASSTGAVLPTN